MQDLKKDLRLALVQLEPVLFDKAACLGNTLKKLAEAAENGAEYCGTCNAARPDCDGCVV